jgi:hypothetical protein
MSQAIFYILMLLVTTIVVILWVNGIDYMKENHPDYKGEDLFGEDLYNEHIDDTKHLLSSTKNKEKLINSINKINKPSDEQLLGIYLLGFEDQINNKSIITLNNKLSQKAYNLGRINALTNNNESPIKNISTIQIINKIKQ